MEKRKYYQEEIETMPLEQLQKLQSEKLVKQVKHVYEHLPYYRDLMDKKGVTPDDIHGIEDLHKLPFIEKSDLRETYPNGMRAMPLEDCVRIQSTSGTTGKRVIAFYTQHDMDVWYEMCARALVAAGATMNCSWRSVLPEDIGRVREPSFSLPPFRPAPPVKRP